MIHFTYHIVYTYSDYTREGRKTIISKSHENSFFRKEKTKNSKSRSTDEEHRREFLLFTSCYQQNRKKNSKCNEREQLVFVDVGQEKLDRYETECETHET